MSALTPATAAMGLSSGAVAKEGTWEKSGTPLESRLAEPLQIPGRHQGNGTAAYDFEPDSLLAAKGTARTFTSTDPLVADLANKIESLYPGHVVGVNVPLRSAAGTLITDADILLQNSVLQVKSGGSAQGLLRQLQRSEAATGLPSIGFGPNLPANSLRTLSQQGGLVTGSENLLLQVVKP